MVVVGRVGHGEDPTSVARQCPYQGTVTPAEKKLNFSLSERANASKLLRLIDKEITMKRVGVK